MSKIAIINGKLQFTWIEGQYVGHRDLKWYEYIIYLKQIIKITLGQNS